MKRRRGFDTVDVIATLAIVGFLGLAVAGITYSITVEGPRAYTAWCKHTGNPGELTYKEWQALVSQTNDSTITPIFIHTHGR